MGRSVFMTGFPGFIAQRLIDRLVTKDPEATFTFLIEERLRDMAMRCIEMLDKKHPGFAPRTRLMAGDITAFQMGLAQADYESLMAETTHVWHLAAIYNLAVHSSVAYRVNVIGTSNVLDFCEDCKQLKRLDYVSTCYVSGDRKGRVLESELDLGQSFKNHYESTKCWAEMEVRRRMHRIPAVIYRPAIVVGDSHTGETDKYDGPYFIMQLMMRLPTWLPMLNIGQGTAPVNIVPVDFLTDAMATIWTNDKAVGMTVQLADPKPHMAKDVMDTMLKQLGFNTPLASVPAGLVENALDIEALRNKIKVPKEAVIYFNHEVEYDTANQKMLLEGTGVSCPDFLSYLPTLIEYVRQHPEKSFLDGRAF